MDAEQWTVPTLTNVRWNSSVAYQITSNSPTGPDETYLHYGEKTTSDERIILFCDVERPLTSKAIINESAAQN